MPPQNAFQSRAGVSHSARLFVILLIGLLVVVAVGIYEFAYVHPGSTNSVGRFSLIEGGTIHWYEAGAGKVTAVPGPAGYDTNPNMIQEVAATLASKETPVLAGTAVGIMSSNGAYTQIFDDGIAKMSLTAEPDHAWVVFTEVATSSSNIMLLSASDPQVKPVVVSKGFGPVFQGTYLVAFDSFGLVRMGTDGSNRTLLAEEPNQALGTAIIAPDGSVAVAKNAAGGIDVFRIVPDRSRAVSLGSVKAAADAIGFVTPQEIVVRSGNTFTFYSIAADKVSLAGTASL